MCWKTAGTGGSDCTTSAAKPLRRRQLRRQRVTRLRGRLADRNDPVGDCVDRRPRGRRPASSSSCSGTPAAARLDRTGQSVGLEAAGEPAACRRSSSGTPTSIRHAASSRSNGATLPGTRLHLTAHAGCPSVPKQTQTARCRSSPHRARETSPARAPPRSQPPRRREATVARDRADRRSPAARPEHRRPRRAEPPVSRGACQASGRAAARAARRRVRRQRREARTAAERPAGPHKKERVDIPAAPQRSHSPAEHDHRGCSGRGGLLADDPVAATTSPDPVRRPPPPPRGARRPNPPARRAARLSGRARTQAGGHLRPGSSWSRPSTAGRRLSPCARPASRVAIAATRRPTSSRDAVASAVDRYHRPTR